jgi:hypothetical protein
MINKDDPLVIPVFRTMPPVKNEEKSLKEGRPIYDDGMEVVEVRFAGDRNKVSVFPAHVICGETVDEYGDTHRITYAERWKRQYERFKAKEHQVMEGTPISELPFLTEAKRSELRALSIYTAETLAALDGGPLKNLGHGGRDMKDQAVAYLARAAGTADVTGMAAKISDLERLVAELRADKPVVSDSQFASWQPDQIKDWIEEQLGERPRGNPNHATLVKRADEIALSLSDEQAA